MYTRVLCVFLCVHVCVHVFVCMCTCVCVRCAFIELHAVRVPLLELLIKVTLFVVCSMLTVTGLLLCHR